MELPPVNKDVRISVWQGDITQLMSDKATGIFMTEPVADTLAVYTASVCFYVSFHRLLKSMENGNMAEK